MKKLIFVWLILSVLSFEFAFAQEATDTLLPPQDPQIVIPDPAPQPIPEIVPEPPAILVDVDITDGENSFSMADVPVQIGTLSITDSDGTNHDIDAQSVLAVLYYLDKNTTDFRVGELVYYSSFNALYLRCMSLKGSNKCDNWMYEVNDSEPSVGMDNYILTGGEDIKIYYNSFWGEPEVPEDPAPSPSPEKTTSGGSSKRKSQQKEEPATEETLAANVTTVEDKALVPAYIAFPQFYTPNEVVGEVAGAETSNEVDESSILAEADLSPESDTDEDDKKGNGASKVVLSFAFGLGLGLGLGLLIRKIKIG